MKRAFCGLVIMTVASILFFDAIRHSYVGNFKYVDIEILTVKLCMASAVALILWIKIPEWASGIKDWAQRPKWRR